MATVLASDETKSIRGIVFTRKNPTLNLDFFICFSSIAAALGSAGQGNYAAANAFLDGLMHYRQSQGLPGLSINWGLWEIGMAAHLNSAERSRLSSQGLRTIEPNQGLTILSQFLNQNTPQVSIFPVNWVKFLEQLPGDKNNSLFKPIQNTINYS
ncbi:MAG: KR domain-containing protein [Microcoleaceae cyanobacterium]